MTDSPEASDKAREQELRDALQELEQAAETPFIPGELEQWTTSLVAGVQRVVPLLAIERSQAHAAEFKQIMDEDAGLAQRVAQMQKEDQAIRETGNRLQQEATQLEQKLRNAAREQISMETALTRLANETLEFVIQVRKQQMAVRTWLVEAFERDRGVID